LHNHIEKMLQSMQEQLSEVKQQNLEMRQQLGGVQQQQGEMATTIRMANWEALRWRRIEWTRIPYPSRVPVLSRRLFICDKKKISSLCILDFGSSLVDW
jgi:hypothetical protein